MKQGRSALARMQVALIILLVVVVAGVGAYVLSTQSGNETRLAIRETDPANQIDSLIPQNVTVKQGTTVNLVVQNGDDEIRVLTIADFNVNMTIDAGTSQRTSFTADKTGTFVIHSPQTAPSAASGGKPGSPVTGYLTVTP